MEPYRQLYLADILRAYREHLGEVLDDIHARGAPLTDCEVSLIKEVAAARLESVEDQLRFDGEQHMRGPRAKVLALIPPSWRRLLARLRGLTRPRIGMLRHYPPRPLQVSAAYLRAAPPTPAPTISIVTPSYAQGRFLERSIHSVLRQNYPALEYFVQDGGSTDETLEILGRYDGRLTGWASEPDGGQADAINRGFRHTSGEIMGWLNSDDILLPGSLAYVARYFAAHQDVDVVYGNRLMIDKDDGQIGSWILPKHNDVALTVADYIPQETLFWRRRIWDAAGGQVDTSFGYALDWDLLLRFREAGAKMTRLPRFLGAFRIHDEQKTTADHAVGLAETVRLRQRVYGREVTIEEIAERLKPYLRRHVLAHSWRIFVDRLPGQRIRVTTRPTELPNGSATTVPTSRTAVAASAARGSRPTRS